MSGARAQETPKLQVHVDFVKGSDRLALARTPSALGRHRCFRLTLETPLDIAGELQHVPYAAKSATAVLNQINSRPVSGAQPTWRSVD